MRWTSSFRTSVLSLAAAALLGGEALAAGKEVKIGVIYDFTGPFAAGGSAAAAIGTQEARRCPVQGRGRDQPGRAPAQSGACRSDHGLLLQRLLRPALPKGRRREEVHVDQPLHRLGGPQGQEFDARVPGACPQRPVRLGVLQLPQRVQPKEDGDRAQGPEGRDHPRGRGPMAPASPPATRNIAARTACRSPSTRATRRPPRICRAW